MPASMPAPAHRYGRASYTHRDHYRWQEVSKILNQNVQFSGKNHSDSISVSVPTSDVYRQATPSLRAKQTEFHSYPLEDEKVLRGLRKEIDTDLVRKDLLSQGLPVQQVHRMTNGRTKAPIDLVLVILDYTTEGKRIFQIERVLNLFGLQVEAPRPKGIPGQCHRCKLYGHSVRFCEAAFRCVKCAGDNSTALCKRAKADPNPPSCMRNS